MSSGSAPGWTPVNDATQNQQDYAAAESLLQHSRSAGGTQSAMTGFPGGISPSTTEQTTAGYMIAPTPAPLMDVLSPVQYHTQFSQAFQQPGTAPEHVPQPFGSSLGPAPPTPQLQNQFDHQLQSQTQVQDSTPPNVGYDGGNSEHGRRNPLSADGSDSASPVIGRGSNTATSWISRNDERSAQPVIKEDVDGKPAWSELKTKAGKERKRLPLACIACRRKKIRCSGEKPACKHCQRSRVPCVYKVTARKPAPRTDYMAMLDRRLKRMEERVIKIIPKDEAPDTASVPRAVLKPTAGNQPMSGKKRGAEEAFGSQLDKWAETKTTAQLQKVKRAEESKINLEGAEHLPSPEIQEHLSEVFFDYLYGQSYHLMHKPSYMRRLRAGTLPPVLILAVCSISARFSTHPQIETEPAFLRGEEWAAPARDIVIRRYDEPNITMITVLLLLGLHEFGTCHGGRSWMFAGMAERMAYALQLHRELDHDPLGKRNDRKSELSFTDREIRRRTMWACFMMDRFTASGTERPMSADEDSIKVQLPIKEAHFQMDIPGPTESLDGRVPNPVTTHTGQLADVNVNMGVAAYMIRAIALWGRVIKHLNMGGQEKDPLPMWDPNSQYSDLRRQAAEFASTLPPELQNTRDNLHNHAAERLANQFIFLHVVAYQVTLFLHRFAIPTSPGARNPTQMPKSFVAEAGPIALEAASQISGLLGDALQHNAVAPFISYCAFLSGTVHIWGIYSKNPSFEVSSKQRLGGNVKYLSKMERYWGMCPFMVKNLKDIYREHADASLRGTSETSSQDAAIFQYGDWFTRYPHGVSRTEYEDNTKIKKEVADDAALSQKSDLQTVEAFFQTLSPSSNSSGSKASANKRSARKNAKTASSAQQGKPATQLPHPHLHMDTTTITPHHHQQQQQQQQQHPTTMIAIPQSDPHQHHQQPPITPMTPYTPTHPQAVPQPPPQLYNNFQPPPTTPHDLLPIHTPANTALLPQFDRSLVYDAYCIDSPDSSSAAAAVMNSGLPPPQNFASNAGGGNGAGAGPMWDDGSVDATGAGGGGMNLQQHQQQQMMIAAAAAAAAAQQNGGGGGMASDLDVGSAGGAGGGYMNDMQTSAWFMPFNMMPPGIDIDVDGVGGGVGGGVEEMGGIP